VSGGKVDATGYRASRNEIDDLFVNGADRLLCFAGGSAEVRGRIRLGYLRATRNLSSSSVTNVSGFHVAFVEQLQQCSFIDQTTTLQR
jgi:hypothetical protein